MVNTNMNKAKNKILLNQKKSKFKEIKFHPRIDEHDYQTKLKKICEFLNKGSQKTE